MSQLPDSTVRLSGRTMRTALTFMLVLLSVAAVSGCGQKGELVRPDAPKTGALVSGGHQPVAVASRNHGMAGTAPQVPRASKV